MDLAHTSRYWKSYRESKTFTLTIYIYKAHLGVLSSNNSTMSSNASIDTSLSGSGTGGGGPWDTKIVVSLPKYPMGERHETSRAGKTYNPVWDQAVVLKDIEYSELVRVEMRRPRKIGENPVLASVEFEVHDVIGLSLREGKSSFQLECDRSRARYGTIWLAFRFDPPVAADVLGALDGAGPAAVAKGVTTAPGRGQDEDGKAPAWGAAVTGLQPEAKLEMVEPVYINVEGHFACLLLDDDAPVTLPCKGGLARLPWSSSFSVPPSGSSASKNPSDVTPDFDSAQSNPRWSLSRSKGGTAAVSNFNNPRLSVASHNSVKSENSVNDSESFMHGRGSAVKMAMSGNSGGGGGGGAGAVKSFRLRPASLSSSVAQLAALGLGVGGGGGGSKAGGKLKRPASVQLRRTSSSSGGGNPDDSAAEKNGRGSKGNGRPSRSRGYWTPGFLKSPTLGGLRVGVGKAGRARSKSASPPMTMPDRADGRRAGREPTSPADSADSPCACIEPRGFAPAALAPLPLCALPPGLELSPPPITTRLGASSTAGVSPAE